MHHVVVAHEGEEEDGVIDHIVDKEVIGQMAVHAVRVLGHALHKTDGAEQG